MKKTTLSLLLVSSLILQGAVALNAAAPYKAPSQKTCG